MGAGSGTSRVPVLPLFALAAPPDSPLTSLLHVVVGATLVWLATSTGRYDDGTFIRTRERSAGRPA